MKHRILILSNLKQNGYGESTRPYYLGKAFAEAGHSVLNLCDYTGSESSKFGFIKKYPFGESLTFNIRVLNLLTLFIKTRLFCPDIIYVHQLNNWTWARLSKTLPNATRVYDSHTSVYFEHGHFGASESGQKVTFERERNAIKEADHVITVSKETKEYLMRTYKADNESITIVKNATQLSPIDRPVHPANQRFTCSIILPIDGFESNSMALKMLLSVAQETEKTDPEIRFVVIGGGNKPDPKSQNVYYTGFVPDLGAEILKSDLCLNTYPKDAVCGGTRNKVCDYLVLGQPIISTKEGMRGFDDCVPGEDYVLANDVKSTVSKILELKNNPDRLIKLRFKALTKGIDYQWSKKAKEVLKVFDSL